MKIRNVIILSLAFFFVYFIQYPLNDSLPGQCDTFINLSIFNDYYNRFESLITQHEIGRPHYPTYLFQSYSELYIGEAALYLPFHILGFEDIWAYYFFISILYALNSIGAFIFFKQFKINEIFCFAGGLTFSMNVFSLSQIELLNGIPYFFSFLAFASIIQFYRTANSTFLYKTAIFTAIQLYFSAYIMIYTIIILLVFLGLILLKRHSIFKLSTIIKSLILYILIIAPYAMILFKFGFNEGDVNMISMNQIHHFSLHLDDLIRPLNGNAIYSDQYKISNENSLRIVNHCFIGFTIYILGIIGIFYSKGINRFFILLLITLGIVISFGPEFVWNGKVYKTLLFTFYEHLNLNNYLRIPSRAFSLVIIGIILSAIVFLNQSFFSKYKKIVAGIFILLFFIENVPLSIKFNYIKKDMKIPEEMWLSLKSMQDTSVIINLPSTIFSNKGYISNGKDEYSREVLFLYWQTIHKKNSINGISSFVSKDRIKADTWIKNHQWDSLIHHFDIDKMYFIKDKIYYEEDKNVYFSLMNYQQVEVELDNNFFTIFQVKK